MSLLHAVLVCFVSGTTSVQAQSAPTAAVTFGMRFQPNVSSHIGRGGFHYRVLPVGPTAGIQLELLAQQRSVVRLIAETTLFPLTETRITTVGTPTDKPQSLWLVGGGLEWSGRQPGGIPAFANLQLVHALTSPQDVGHLAVAFGIGGIRRLTPRLDLRIGVEGLSTAVGASRLQFPLLLSFHPSAPVIGR